MLVGPRTRRLLDAVPGSTARAGRSALAKRTTAGKRSDPSYTNNSWEVGDANRCLRFCPKCDIRVSTFAPCVGRSKETVRRC